MEDAGRNPLAALVALERFHDGEITWADRAIAFLGNPAIVRLCEARGRAAYYRVLAIGQLTRVIWPRRRDGSYRPYMRDDLRLYVSRARAAERDAARLAAEVDELGKILCADGAVPRAAE